MPRICTTAVLTLFCAVGLAAQDREWVRAWERVQRTRPAKIPTVARIAPANEPGTPLVIHGRVMLADGVTPAAGVVVFAYQTDRGGIYSNRGAHEWRLRGWAKTDERGRFEFRTIRPGSYPNSRIPAHVHFSIEGPGVPRRWTDELRFADDPYLGARDVQSAGQRFGSVRRVTVRSGVQQVDFEIRVSEQGRF